MRSVQIKALEKSARSSCGFREAAAEGALVGLSLQSGAPSPGLGGGACRGAWPLHSQAFAHCGRVPPSTSWRDLVRHPSGARGDQEGRYTARAGCVQVSCPWARLRSSWPYRHVCLFAPLVLGVLPLDRSHDTVIWKSTVESDAQKLKYNIITPFNQVRPSALPVSPVFEGECAS